VAAGVTTVRIGIGKWQNSAIEVSRV